MPGVLSGLLSSDFRIKVWKINVSKLNICEHFKIMAAAPTLVGSKMESKAPQKLQ